MFPHTQVLSSEQGWSVQPRGKPAAAEDAEECRWQLLQPQVINWDIDTNVTYLEKW